MGKLQLLFLALLGVQVSCCGTDPIIRVEMRTQDRNQNAFRPLHLPKYTRVTNDPSHLFKLDPSQMGLLFSHLLGLSPSQHLTWGGVTSSSFLSRPRAISLITVEGLPEDRGLSAPEGTPSYRVERDRSVGEWLSGAFNPSLLRSRIVEMAAGHKEPLMVSVAGEERVASAGPRGVKMIKKYFNSDIKKLNIISDYQHTETAYNQLIKQFHTLDIDSSVSVSADSETILVRRQDGSEVLFNLKFTADLTFFTEILAAMDTIEDMRHREETFDTSPDLIAISFSSLKALRLKYGDSSPQVSAAIEVYAALLPKLTNQIVSLYEGQVAVFGLSLAWTNPTGHTVAQSVSDIFHVAYSHLETQDLKHFQLNFPEIIFAKDSESDPSRLDHVCTLATKINERTQLMRVSCPHRMRRQTVYFSQTNNNTNNSIDPNSFATDKSAEFPYMFNIILLIVLLFAISLFAISWAMWFLDPGMDSIIYRTTEPAKLKLD